MDKDITRPDKKCKDCMMVVSEKVPICNYHQGYSKAKEETLREVRPIHEAELCKVRKDTLQEVMKLIEWRMMVLSDPDYADTYERKCMYDELRFIKQKIEELHSKCGRR